MRGMPAGGVEQALNVAEVLLLEGGCGRQKRRSAAGIGRIECELTMPTADRRVGQRPGTDGAERLRHRPARTVCARRVG